MNAVDLDEARDVVAEAVATQATRGSGSNVVALRFVTATGSVEPTDATMHEHLTAVVVATGVAALFALGDDTARAARRIGAALREQCSPVSIVVV